MKPEKQRLAVLNELGWTPVEGAWLGPRAGFPPDPLTDLNAMHEAEKTIYSDPEKSNRYAEFILDVLEVPGPFIGTARCAFLTNHATAAQRAEAFLRTLGKWTED